MSIINYIKATWYNRRYWNYPITFILAEMIRGIFVQVNSLTEI